MAAEISFTQSSFRDRRVFEFALESLKYTWKDASGERTFLVPYATIDVTNPAYLTINYPKTARRLFFIPLALILGSIGDRFLGASNTGELIGLGVIVLLGLLVAHLLGAFTVRYTMFPMAPMPPGAVSNLIMVIHNEDTGQIIDELKARWKSALKMQYGTANPAGNFEQEVARLKWLLDREVITESELQDQLRRLRSSDLSGEAADKPSFN